MVGEEGGCVSPVIEENGFVSLVGEEDGCVSLVGEEDGCVSLVGEEEDRLILFNLNSKLYRIEDYLNDNIIHYWKITCF